ncbi:FG-GAP-like repeat-containing protein, partial [Nostoc sp. XA013]|nr:FG-GAP-like repeat-containing protein [Nostoc sp. XA013]
MLTHVGYVAAVGCIALLSSFSDVRGQTATSSTDALPARPPSTASNGSFTYSVPIGVPDFRGIEPKLAISYDSTRGIRNAPSAGGWLGMGWKLTGLSAIERVSGSPVPTAGQGKLPGGRGSPAHGAVGMPPDSFLLDGGELVICAELQNPSSSPSCDAGVGAGQAAYAGRVENYLRIRKNDTANTWEVTDPTGVKYEYSAIQGGTSATTFRWNLTKVIDRRGNHVDYAYSCSAGEGCVVSTISYLNQASSSAVATIAFHYESQNEYLTYATGTGLLDSKLRLKTIRVLSGATLVRAYTLTYSPANSSPSTWTNLRLLTHVQQFGNDATFDGAWSVSGGTALPATTFGYSFSDFLVDYPDAIWAGIPASPTGRSGDFNGDGRTDLCATKIKLSTGAAFTELSTANCGTNDVIADFTGDGADDLLTVSGNPAQIRINTLAGTTLTALTVLTSPVAGIVFDGGIKAVGDFNGDGKADIATTNRNIWLSDGTTFSKVTGVQTPNFANLTVRVGDVNGDGKSDLILYNSTSFTAHLSTGQAFVAQTTRSTPTGMFMFGDGNGDGRIVQFRFEGICERVSRFVSFACGHIHYSNGQNFEAMAVVRKFPILGADGYSGPISVVDVSGDGRADVLMNSIYPSPYTDYLTFNAGNPSGSVEGDFDGDGRADFLGDFSGSNNIRLSAGNFPADFLTSIVEPLGGKIAIEYEPSSGKPDTKLPYVMHVIKSVTVTDGRGTVGSPNWQ